MANVPQNLADIINARYGKDVRQAIHDSIQACYTESKFVPRGAYSSTATYSFPDMVTHGGGSYLYINPTPAAGVSVTDTSHWQQIASKGLKGDTGDVTPEAEAARDAAEGYKNEAQAYAAQLQAGIGSPADWYADLAAVKTANPAHDRTYGTENDGKLAYWSTIANDWVAGGVYQAASVVGDIASINTRLGGLSFAVDPVDAGLNITYTY